MKSKNIGRISAKWIPIFSMCFFFLGVMFTNKFGVPVESNQQLITRQRREQELQIVSEDCNTSKKRGGDEEKDVMKEVYKTHEAIQNESEVMNLGGAMVGSKGGTSLKMEDVI